jgi:hypothetical protein
MSLFQLGLQRCARVVALASLACDGGVDPGTPVDTEIDTEQAVDTEPAETDAEVPLTGLWGFVVDESGARVPEERVLACTEVNCVVGESDAQGRFSFEVDGPLQIALKTAARPSEGVGVGLISCQVGEDGQHEAGALRVPSLPPLLAIDTSDTEVLDLEIGDGLTLTAAPADLRAVPGERLTHLAARRLPASWNGPYPGLEEEVVAVYTLHPFGGSSVVPVPLSAPVDLTDGTQVRFRTVSYLNGSLSEPVTGQVVDGLAKTHPGEGVVALSQVILTLAP